MSSNTLTVDIRLRRPGRTAFTLDVKVEFPPGITVLSGPSGAGKSTLLQAVAGLERPDDGRIAIGEKTWFDGRINVAAHKRGVAYVFQNLALFPHMSVLENVTFGVDHKLPHKERQSRALNMLERMRTAGLSPRRPGTLSGGEAQRVALARAFAMAPRAVLLDEPFSALDRDLRRDLIAQLSLLAKEFDIPFIHVTHNRQEARAIASRMVLLTSGRVEKIGAVDEIWPKDDDGDLRPTLRTVDR